jgi:drug/metabolite transporter (DMT)-like permease
VKEAAAGRSAKPIDLTAVVVLTLCCALWGVNHVAVKVTNEGISPLFQAGLRSALAAGLLVLWSAWRGIALFRADGTLWPGLAAGALFAGNFMFIGPGLELTSASRAVLFLYAAPFLLAFGAHFLIAGERVTGAKLLGFVAAFAGLALSTVGRGHITVAPHQALGDFYCFVAAAFWAGTTLVVRTTCLKAIKPEKTLLYQLAVSVPLLFAGSFLMGEAGVTKATPLILWSFAFSTVAVVFISYALWFWLLSVYPAADVSVFTFLTPVFGVLAGHLLLDEAVGWPLAGALILIAAGIALVAKPSTNRTAGTAGRS